MNYSHVLGLEFRCIKWQNQPSLLILIFLAYLLYLTTKLCWFTTYLQNSAQVLLSVTRYWLIISSLQWTASLEITHLFDVINGGNNSSSWVKIVWVVNFCILGHQHLSPHYSHCACHQPHFPSQKSTPTLSNCFCFFFGSLLMGRGRRKESCGQFLISQHSDSPRKQRLRDASSALPPSTSFAQFLQQQKTLHNSSNNKKNIRRISFDNNYFAQFHHLHRTWKSGLLAKRKQKTYLAAVIRKLNRNHVLDIVFWESFFCCFCEETVIHQHCSHICKTQNTHTLCGKKHT